MTDSQKKAATQRVAAAAAVALGASLVLVAPSSADTTSGTGYIRTFGENRYETAVAIAGPNAVFDECAGDSINAIVTTGQNFPDALAGSLASGAALDLSGDVAPILLTESDEDELNSETADYLDDCDVRNVVVLGGEDAVSEDVFDEIADIPGINNVTRVSGDNRYETAVAVAEAYLDNFPAFQGLDQVGGTALDYDEVVFLATGQEYADALSAGPQAFKGHGILLTKSAALSNGDPTYEFFEDWDGNTADQAVVILGGTNAVSQDVEDTLNDDFEFDVLRPAAGDNRYDTAALLWTLLTDVFDEPDMENVGIASGQEFPDALASASYLGVAQAPLVLVKQDTPLPAETAFFLNDFRSEIGLIHAFGGTAAISQAVVLEARDTAQATIVP